MNLERRINEMERTQARTHAENAELSEENTDLRNRLEAASQTIDTLMGQLDQRRGGSVARQRLDAGDIAVLDRLTRTSPSAGSRIHRSADPGALREGVPPLSRRAPVPWPGAHRTRSVAR